MSNTYFIHLTKEVCVVTTGASLVFLLGVPLQLQRCFRRINEITHIQPWTKCEREETPNFTIKKINLLAVTLLEYARTSNCFNTICSVVVTPAGKCNMLIIRPPQRRFLT